MSTFVGHYVEELRDAVYASAASGLHLQAIGKPGTGKTAIIHATLKAIYGDKMVFTRFNPSTPVEKVEGFLDFAALMKETPEWIVKTEGTPYDPDCEAWMADEVYRSNMAVLDKLIDSLDRWDIDPLNSALVIATANFLPKDERAEALLDRFGLTYWLKTNGDFTTKDVAMARMKANNQRLEVPGLTTQSERDDVAKAIKFARTVTFTERACEVVANTVKEITRVAEEGLTDAEGNAVRVFGPINNRRATYWADMLSRTTALYSGTGDFDQIHPKALESLSFAWTSRSQEEADDWRTLMGNVVDPIQSAINAALKATYETMAERAQGRNAADVANELGKIVIVAADNIKHFVGDDDPRYKQFILDLQLHVAEYIREAQNVSKP